jgi:hypothetical protein
MSQRKSQLNLFADYVPFIPRRQKIGGVTGNTKQYPRRPFPKYAALLIDPVARTIRTVFIRTTATGIKSIFGRQPVTFQDRDYHRAYGIRQDYHEVTDRATLPGARLSIQGKILITGPKLTEIIGEVSNEIMKGTTFSRCDAYEPQRVSPLSFGEGAGERVNTHPVLSQNSFACQ